MENILKKSMTKLRRSVQNTNQLNQLFLKSSNLSFFIDEKLMKISDFDTFKVIRWIHENGKVKLTFLEELKEPAAPKPSNIKEIQRGRKNNHFSLYCGFGFWTLGSFYFLPRLRI